MNTEFINSNKTLHDFIGDRRKTARPFLVGRLSCLEPIATHQIILNKLSPQTRYALGNNAGIYCVDDNSLKKWGREYYDAMKNSGALGIWEKEGGVYKYTGPSQEFFLASIKPNVTFLAPCLDAFFFTGTSGPSWEEPLRGQRILVVSPFVESIQSQITSGKLGHLFKNLPNWFNGCSFLYVKPPVTQAGNHGGKDWQDNFAELCRRCDECGEFDVALLSCGGYGMPLANYIYKKGKSAIYVGGCLQLFFGIMGSRWQNNKELAEIMITENWIRPSNEERPKNFKAIEGGCYW